MSLPPGELDERALAAVDALVARALHSSVSFGAEGGEAGDAAELRALLDEATATGPAADRSRWQAACDELFAFLRRVEEDLAHLAVVRGSTPRGGGAISWQRWGGTTVTVIGGRFPRPSLTRHAAQVRDEAAVHLTRLRLLALTATAATRIGAHLAVSGGSFLALPVAFRLVRAIGGELEAHGRQAPPRRRAPTYRRGAALPSPAAPGPRPG